MIFIALWISVCLPHTSRLQSACMPGVVAVTDDMRFVEIRLRATNPHRGFIFIAYHRHNPPLQLSLSSAASSCDDS